MNLENRLFLAKNLKRAVFVILAASFFMAASDFTLPLASPGKIQYLLVVIGMAISSFLLIRLYSKIIADYETQLMKAILSDVGQILNHCRWCDVLRLRRN